MNWGYSIHGILLSLRVTIYVLLLTCNDNNAGYYTHVFLLCIPVMMTMCYA